LLCGERRDEIGGGRKIVYRSQQRKLRQGGRGSFIDRLKGRGWIYFDKGSERKRAIGDQRKIAGGFVRWGGLVGGEDMRNTQDD